MYGIITKIPEAQKQYLTENQQTKYLSTYEARVLIIQIILEIYCKISYFESSFNTRLYRIEKIV